MLNKIRNKLSEHGWIEVSRYVSAVFYRYILRLLSTYYCKLKCRISGIKYGASLKCWGNVYLQRNLGGTIRIGDNVSIVSSSKRCSSGPIYSPTKIKIFTSTAKIILGNNVGLNGTSLVARSKHIIIEDNVMIGPNVTIMDSDFHPIEPEKRINGETGIENDAPVTIKENAWIGSGAMILKGVTIGKGSIVGARSVVCKDIPDGFIAAGNPAKPIRKI